MDKRFNELVTLSKEFTGYDVTRTRSRKRDVINIKSAICNVMRRYYSRTLPQIANQLKIHHTTVIHHLKDHPNRYRDIDDYADLYDHLSKNVVEGSEYLPTEKILATMKEVFA